MCFPPSQKKKVAVKKMKFVVALASVDAGKFLFLLSWKDRCGWFC